MLDKDRYVAACRPELPEKGGPSSRPPKPVTENNDRRLHVAAGQVHQNGNLSLLFPIGEASIQGFRQIMGRSSCSMGRKRLLRRLCSRLIRLKESLFERLSAYPH